MGTRSKPLFSPHPRRPGKLVMRPCTVRGPVPLGDVQQALMALSPDSRASHGRRRSAWAVVRRRVKQIIHHVPEDRRTDADWSLIELWAKRLSTRPGHRLRYQT